MAAPSVSVQGVIEPLNSCLTKLGFEVYPLKVGWYNSVLSPSFHLPYHDETLAVVVLSTPAMFDQAFLPFLEQRGVQRPSDPIDQCVQHCVSTAVQRVREEVYRKCPALEQSTISHNRCGAMKPWWNGTCCSSHGISRMCREVVSQTSPELKVDVRYDYELLPSRKPKFLAQTAAHVSGAAFYYQQSVVTDQPWAGKKMFGVCIHPRLGGWFAIRALLVFEGVTVGSELVQPAPPDCVPSRDDRIKLLEAFNFHWQDWSYRDIIPSEQIYSERQKEYFSTPPAQRLTLLTTWGFFPKDDAQPNLSPHTQSQANGHG